MKKEIIPEELLSYKSKLRFYTFLSERNKIGIYAEEVLFSHQGYYWQNWDNKNYILEDKYQGTTSDPVNLKMVLSVLKEKSN